MEEKSRGRSPEAWILSVADFPSYFVDKMSEIVHA